MTIISSAAGWVRRQFGEPRDETAAMVLSAIEEAQDLRKERESRWDRNAQLYGGSHWEKAPPPGSIQYTFNRTQLVCDVITSVITEQRPKTTFSPRESGAPGVWTIIQPQGTTAMSAVESLVQSGAITDPGIAALLGSITSDQWSGRSPLAEKQGKFLSVFIQTEMGRSLGLEEDDVKQINDDVLSDACNVVYEGLWDKSMWDWWFVRCRDGAGIYGHQDSIYQYDVKAGKHQMILAPPKNTWIDPAATDIDDAQHYHWAQILDKDAAIRTYPDLRMEIEEAASTSVEESIGGGSLSDIYTAASYQRPRVTVVHSWFRDHEFEDGEFGILQAKTIAGVTVEQGLCPYRDIPAVRMFNMPIMFRPYGRGEPEIIEGPQNIVNRLGSIIGNVPRFHQYPQVLMSASARKGLKSEQLYNQPNRTLVVDDSAIQAAGGDIRKLIHIEYPASPPTWMFQAFEYFGNMLDEMGGRADVLKGQAPSGISSGVAIDSLRREARGVIGLRAAWAEKALIRQAMLVLGAIADLMPPEQWRRYTDRYPAEILTAVRSRAKDVEMDVVIELASGRGSMKETEQRKSIIMRQQGDLSQKTFMEKMEVQDVEDEQRQILTEKSQQAQLELAISQAAAAQQPRQAVGSQGGPEGSQAQRGEQA